MRYDDIYTPQVSSTLQIAFSNKLKKKINSFQRSQTDKDNNNDHKNDNQNTKKNK